MKKSKQLTWSRLSLAAPLLVSIIGACGGTTQGTPQVGSESHFLAYCSGRCADGLECIAEICTRPCLTSASSCSDLALGAACTNQSVEPGQVAVCDLACNVANDCKQLGAGYTCNSGFCRGPGGGGIGNGGSGGTGSGGTASGGTDSSNGDCHTVGRYETGKEGGYLPCCAGLNEIFTLSLVQDASGAQVCDQLPLRTYACIRGTCGDGTCEEPERSCGCAQDCADVPGSNPQAQCDAYLDQSPPPVVHTVSITNYGSQTLYIPGNGGCGNEFSLLSVDVGTARQPVDIIGRRCMPSCSDVIEEGPRVPNDVPREAWERNPSAFCVLECEQQVVPIAPGQTLTEVARLAYSPQRMPQACADGIVSEAIACDARAIPPMGSSPSVTAFYDANCLSMSAGCAFTISGAGGSYFFEDQTISLYNPAD